MSLKTWFYRGGRPNRVARVLDRGTAALYGRGIAPDYLVTLEVVGRKSGRTIALPLVMVIVEDERYLVSMLGEGELGAQRESGGGQRHSASRLSGGGALGRGRGRLPRIRTTDLPEASAQRQGAPAGFQGRAVGRVRSGSVSVARVPGRVEKQGVSPPSSYHLSTRWRCSIQKRIVASFRTCAELPVFVLLLTSETRPALSTLGRERVWPNPYLTVAASITRTERRRMDLETFLISLYVVVDDWQKLHHLHSLQRVGRHLSLSNAEVLTLAILAQWPRWRSERDFWRYADLYPARTAASSWRTLWVKRQISRIPHPPASESHSPSFSP